MKERLDYLDNLRFPMILGVVFMHSSIYIPASFHDGGFADLFFRFIVALANGRIPTFFFISGFLFFRGIEKFDVSFYKKRMKSRSRSLIIPYILWILICLLYLSLKSMPTVIHEHDLTPITNMLSWRIFWVYSDVYPLHIPLWYIRDLIVMSFFSPVVWQYFKYFKHIGMLLLIVFYVLFRDCFAFTLPIAILFFSLGAYISICNVDFRPVSRLIGWWVVPLLVVLSLIILSGEIYSARLASVFLPLSYLCLSAFLTEQFQLKVPDNLTNSVFFIYATHTIMVTSIVYTLIKIVIPDTVTSWIILIRHVVAVAIITTICILLYHSLKRIIPKTIAILTGSR